MLIISVGLRKSTGNGPQQCRLGSGTCRLPKHWLERIESVKVSDWDELSGGHQEPDKDSLVS